MHLFSGHGIEIFAIYHALAQFVGALQGGKGIFGRCIGFYTHQYVCCMQRIVVAVVSLVQQAFEHRRIDQVGCSEILAVTGQFAQHIRHGVESLCFGILHFGAEGGVKLGVFFQGLAFLVVGHAMAFLQVVAHRLVEFLHEFRLSDLLSANLHHYGVALGLCNVKSEK